MSHDQVNPRRGKREAYEAATKLLSTGDESSLRYAALELRRCPEAVVYEKLSTYGELLPEGSVHKWQPSQAFDALLAIEPDAEHSFTFAIAQQSHVLTPAPGPFQQIGIDERPKAKWIKNNWNKLGFYLHAESPFAKHNKTKKSLRTFLEKLLVETGPLANSLFSAMIVNAIEFECQSCATKVKVMAKSVEASQQAVCLTCGMKYKAEKGQHGFVFSPDQPPFTCDCGASTFVPLDRLRVGFEFACRTCQRGYSIVGADWKYTAVSGSNSNKE